MYVFPRKAMKGGTLVATFASKEMIDVCGSCKFDVQE